MDVGLLDLGAEDDDLGVRIAVARTRGRFIDEPRAIQCPLVGGQLGVGQSQRVVADNDVQGVAIQGEVEPSAALRVEYDGTRVAVDLVEAIGVEVSQQRLGLLDLHVLEQVLHLVLAAVIGRRDQVLAGDAALQIEGHASVDDIVFTLQPRGLDVAVRVHLRELAVGEGHQEQLVLGHLHIPFDHGAATVGIRHADRQPARADRQFGHTGELAERSDLGGRSVDRHGVPRVGRTPQYETRRFQLLVGRRQVDRQVRHRGLDRDQLTRGVAIVDREVETGRARQPLRVARDEVEDVLPRGEIASHGERAVRRDLDRLPIQVDGVARFGASLDTTGRAPGGFAGVAAVLRRVERHCEGPAR